MRREVSSLPPPTQWRLRSALQRALQSGGFQQVAAFHGFPGTICGSAGRPRACCPHMEDVEMFLPWHRLLMAQMEEELGTALPYWDWTSTAAFPSLFEDTWDAIGNSGAHGQGLCDKAHAMYGQRRRGAELIDSRRLQRATDLALRKENFEEFARQLSQPHNDVHNAFHCNLRDTDYAAYDPVFYLRHGQVPTFQFLHPSPHPPGGPPVRLLAGAAAASRAAGRPRAPQARAALPRPQAQSQGGHPGPQHRRGHVRLQEQLLLLLRPGGPSCALGIGSRHQSQSFCHDSD